MTPNEQAGPAINRAQRSALILGVIGVIALVAAFFLQRESFFQSYLYAYMFWSGLTLGSLGIYLLHNVVGGNWGVVIRRFLESGIRTLPLILVAVVPILLGTHFLYKWTDAHYLATHDTVAVKHGYLTVWFFVLRTFVYFAIWFIYGFGLLRMSDNQDRTGDPGQRIAYKMKRWSAPGLVLFMFTTSWAFIDWIMSLEPAWYSSVYPWMFTVGQVLLTFSFAMALLVLFSKTKPFVDILNYQHFNDIGNLMLCFTMLWSYMEFGQFLIIWAENLPDEITWYLRRFSNGWGYVAWFVAVFHFCVPFFLLLMRFIKRNPRFIFGLAVWIICIRALDIFWVVIPAFRQPYLRVSWTDVAAGVGMGGIWVAFFLWHLKSRPLLPLHDPRLGYHTLESEA